MSDPILEEVAMQLRLAGAALTKAADALDQIGPDPAPNAIRTAAELDAALAAANAGDVLLLDPTLIYLAPLVINVSVVLSHAVRWSGARATRAEPMPSFQDGLTVTAQGVQLLGLDIRKIDPLTDIVVLTGASCVLDGCRILGDPILGAKRGIAANAPHVTVRRCYVDDCFGPMPGNDTQAFCAWDSPGPFLIEDNYFSGGAETILFGGADPSSSAHVPADITIRGNTITKNPEWRDHAIVKNLIEFKNARRYLVEDNDLSHCWGGEQGGYAFMITPRNQDGTAPYSEVRSGIIRNNRVSHVGAVLSLLGSDNIHPSGPLDGLIFEDNDCADVDHVAYKGNDKLFLVQRGPLNVTIDGNKIAGGKAGSAVYFGEAPNSCAHFSVTNNTFPPSDYGIMGASCAPGTLNDPHGSAWSTYVTSGTLKGNVAQS